VQDRLTVKDNLDCAYEHKHNYDLEMHARNFVNKKLCHAKAPPVSA